LRNVPWTEAEIEVLKKLWSTEVDFDQIDQVLSGRSRNAITSKASKLGLATPASRFKPKIDYELLKKLGVVVEG